MAPSSANRNPESRKPARAFPPASALFERVSAFEGGKLTGPIVPWQGSPRRLPAVFLEMRSPFLPNLVGRGGVAEPYQQLGRGTRLASYEPDSLRGFSALVRCLHLGLNRSPAPVSSAGAGCFFGLVDSIFSLCDGTLHSLDRSLGA